MSFGFKGLKVKLSIVFNNASGHVDVRGGGKTPRILNLGTKWT
jgi:hypothetical protein